MPFIGSPYIAITAPQVAVDAPVSTTLMSQVRNNGIWFKSALTDGVNASQGIDTSTVTTSGNFTAGGDIAVNGGNFTSTVTNFSYTPKMSFNGGGTFDQNITVIGVNFNLFQANVEAVGF
jgi:hypothetical protein